MDELDVHAVDERDRLVEGYRLQLRQRAKRVGLAIERQRRIVPRVMKPVGLARVLFLQPGRVGQHQLAEIGRARRAKDALVIAIGDEPRQVAGVIEVRVREHGGGQVGRIDRQRLPIAKPQLLEALKQSAVDQDLVATGLERDTSTRSPCARPQER